MFSSRLVIVASVCLTVVQIVDGRIHFRFNLGGRSSDSDVSLSAVNVSDGAWHSVRVERHGQWSVLSLDHGEGSFTNQTLPVTPGDGRVQFMMAPQGVFAGGNVRFPSATSSPLISQDFVDGQLSRHLFDMVYVCLSVSLTRCLSVCVSL